MAKEVKIPDIGGFEGVEVIDVLVAAGDKVAKEDSLITLESDKAAMDVPAPFAGTVKEIKIKTGDKVSEGDVFLTIEESDEPEQAPAAKDDSGDDNDTGKNENQDRGEQDEKKGKTEAKPKEPAESDEEDASDAEPERAAPTPPTVDAISRVASHAGPSVRKFARELGVDLAAVKGSGHKNRITQEDVKRYVKSALRGGGGTGLPAVAAVDFSRYGEIERKPLSRIKRISGPRLQAAWVNVPHVTQHDEADITELEALRKALKSDAEARGAKLTMLAFLVRACVAALKEFPDFNASLDPDGETLIYKKYFHVGFAVDSEGGLLVPVLHDAEAKNLLDIAVELGELATKAREGKLKPGDMQGGCFTITSLGGIGGTAFTPIVNAPEVAILGVSRAAMKPVWNDDKFEPRLMLPLSLSYDHRVIDGASAARFTRFLAETLADMQGLVF
ncbi:MAG: dihydrolipoyllysine-residue acetyltransferase [Gammaproteobacteria bacterium]